MRKILIIFSLVLIIMTGCFVKCEEVESFNAKELVVKNSYEKVFGNGLNIYADDLIENSKKESDMKKNTAYLQQIIDEASNAGGGIVNIPKGTYYFSPANEKNFYGDNRIIKCKNNVTIKGARK